MKAEVRQATEQLFSEDATGHEHVADVEIPDNMDTTDALERAFYLTNHINQLGETIAKSLVS